MYTLSHMNNVFFYMSEQDAQTKPQTRLCPLSEKQ